MRFLLPGMGADGRMYSGHWMGLQNTEAISWPTYQGETTLTELAARIVRIYGIKAGDDLVGSSLGGMVACEIANMIDVRSLILIGSAAHPSEVSTLLRILSPLSSIAPFGAIKLSSGSIPHGLTQMFSDAEVAFVRAMIPAIFKWHGLERRPPQFYRIHGRSDHVIPIPDSCDLILEGGHLLAMTHDLECVTFLNRPNKAGEPMPASA